MERVLRLIEKVRIIDRVALLIAIGSVLTSCLLAKVYGERAYVIGPGLKTAALPTYFWISIQMCIWVFLLSSVALIISAIIYRFNNKKVWNTFKWEILLTLGCIPSLLLVYICILTS